MVARNEITGDAIQTRKASEQYANNYDRIFSKDKKSAIEEQFDAITSKITAQMAEAYLTVKFKPFAEIQENAETLIERLTRLSDNLEKTLREPDEG